MSRTPVIESFDVPDGEEAKSPTTSTVEITLGVRDPSLDYRIKTTVRLYVDGEQVAEKQSKDHLQDETITRSFNHTFSESGDYTIRVGIGQDWYNANNEFINDVSASSNTGAWADSEDDKTERTRTIYIAQQDFTAGRDEEQLLSVTDIDEPTGQGEVAFGSSAYHDVFEGRVPVAIDGIRPDQNAAQRPPPNIIFTPNDNPDISVDSSGRFATHDIIGGITVRQKIGSEPFEITVSGVCDEETAKDIDKLKYARAGIFISERISIRVDFASMSTDPLEQGGAVDMDTGDMLYSYTLNLVGIENVEEPSEEEETETPAGVFET